MTVGLAEFRFSLEGISGFEADIVRGMENLTHDLEWMVTQAGEAGIEEMQHNHPYTDQTYKLSGGMHITDGDFTRTRCTKYIDFLAEYAGFVNDGTSKSKAYPFLPQGITAAQKRLDECASDALASYCRTLSGG